MGVFWEAMRSLGYSPLFSCSFPYDLVSVKMFCEGSSSLLGSKGAAADDADLLDSDDEEPGVSDPFQRREEKYLEKVITDTVDDYVLDEDEIDRKLLVGPALPILFKACWLSVEVRMVVSGNGHQWRC